MYTSGFPTNADQKAAFCTQQANTAQQAEYFPRMHISTVIQLCPLAEIFITDRWERERGWNYRYLTAPVNLCCHRVASCLPREKKLSKGLPLCWGTARAASSWDSLTQWCTESKRERGEWGESCLRFDVYEEMSVFGKHWSYSINEKSVFPQSRLFSLIQHHLQLINWHATQTDRNILRHPAMTWKEDEINKTSGWLIQSLTPLILRHVNRDSSFNTLPSWGLLKHRCWILIQASLLLRIYQWMLM